MEPQVQKIYKWKEPKCSINTTNRTTLVFKSYTTNAKVHSQTLFNITVACIKRNHFRIMYWDVGSSSPTRVGLRPLSQTTMA